MQLYGRLEDLATGLLLPLGAPLEHVLTVHYTLLCIES
jgi:hypothetical protein